MSSYPRPELFDLLTCTRLRYLEGFFIMNAYLEPDFASFPSPRPLFDGHESVSESLDPASRGVIMYFRCTHSSNHVRRDTYVLST